MLCMREEAGDMRQCLPEGREVTACGQELLSKIKAECAAEFTEHAACLHHSQLGYQRMCRPSQWPFEKCMIDRLGIEKPGLGEVQKASKQAKHTRSDIS